MILLAIAVAVGCALGYARNGRLRRLGDLRLQAPALVGLALVLQVGAGPAPEGWRGALIGCSYALVGIFLAANLRGRTTALRAGIALLALGWLLNVAAMAPDRAMPVSATALERTGQASTDVTAGHLSKHLLGNAHAPLRFLGDVIPVPALRAIVSLGDLALLAGVALCIAAAMWGAVRVAALEPDPYPRPWLGSTHNHVPEPFGTLIPAGRHQ